MSLVLLTSIALLLAALGGAVWLLRRSSDPPLWLMAGLFLLLAACAGAAAVETWPAAFGLDLATAASLAALGAAVLAIALVQAVGRTLRDLEGAEALHWRSMETVRALGELAREGPSDGAVPFDALLALGCECFGLEIGLASRIRRRRYELTAIRGPESLPFGPGAALPLGDTFCERVVATGRPVCEANLAKSDLAGLAAHSVLPFGAYLGAPVRVGGALYGTLAFASRSAREEPFTATDRDLANLLADWLGRRIEAQPAPRAAPERPAQPAPRAAPERPAQPEPARVSAAPAPRPAPAPAAAPAPPPAAARPRTTRRLSSGWSTRPIPRRRRSRDEAVDVNAVLRRMEGPLRKAAAPKVALELALGADLAPMRDTRLPLEPVLMSLIAHAVDAMDGGRLCVRTAHLDVAAGSRDWLPPVPPDRYLTISVSDADGALDGDTLSKIFESGEDRDAPGRLSMPTLYRMLQRCGGDLSVEVEPGRASTFTVYLLRAEPTAGVRDAAARPAAPASAPAG